MTDKDNSDDIPVNVISENENNDVDSQTDEQSPLIQENSDEQSPLIQENSDELSTMLESEKQKSAEYEEKFKRVLADFQNLSRKTQSDIEHGINSKIDGFILDFLKIYDDFVRAKEVFSENEADTEGLDSILKNMDSLLKKYNVSSIDALGELFDPNLHEAISVITDSALDDNTIIKEIRKGYISKNRVIRPTLVEISKKG